VVELMSYGLTGLTAMLVIAFCFAYGNELPGTRKKSSYDLVKHAPKNDFRMIETGARSLRLRREVDKQQETAAAPLQRKTSPVGTGHGATYSDSFQNDRRLLEAFHG
jgi:hypothetical protein